MLTFAEGAFIQAEAAARGIGGLSAGQAKGFYEAGIRASMNQCGVTDAAAIGAYLARLEIAYRGGTDGLKQIAIQEWVAQFTDGGLAWATYRRTCQPARLVAGPAAIINYIPRRFYYSTTENAVNADNLAAAVSWQGPDNFGTRIWWDSKPTAAATCQ